jgi:hypothetical protein
MKLRDSLHLSGAMLEFSEQKNLIGEIKKNVIHLSSLTFFDTGVLIYILTIKSHTFSFDGTVVSFENFTPFRAIIDSSTSLILSPSPSRTITSKQFS